MRDSDGNSNLIPVLWAYYGFLICAIKRTKDSGILNFEVEYEDLENYM